MAELFKNILMPNGVVITEWIIIAAIVIFSILATKSMKLVPGKIQNMAEMGVNKLLEFLSGVMGEEMARKFFPMLGTFFIFIIVCNYTGELPGADTLFHVPTSVLACPLALGLISFATIQTSGVRKHGFFGYLKTFLKPVAPLAILTLLEQFVRPLSLILRLYGNLFGEATVTESFYDLFPIGLPWIMNVLALLFCLIQAMIFTMLTAIYIMEATEEEEEEEPKKKKKKSKKAKTAEIAETSEAAA